MTVYVDELRKWAHAKHRCFKAGSAHLTADTEAELHDFAARLGLKRAWFQPTSTPHYDLSPGKHAQALALGATFASARSQAIKRIQARAMTFELPDPSSGDCGGIEWPSLEDFARVDALLGKKRP